MSRQAKKFVTPDEYLALERQAEYKNEYFDGEVFAMVGASRRHNLITTNVGRELSLRLKDRPCEVYSSDMRVRIPSANVYTYPVVVVVCGDRLRLSLRVRGGRVEAARFLAYGCPPTLACGSALAQMLEGMSVDSAARITRQDVARAAGGLPARKGHAAALALETLHAALRALPPDEDDGAGARG